MQEGSTWEAIMACGHHGVDNLCAILDYNKIQQEGSVEHTMNFGPVSTKLQAFHWAVEEMDGHDCEQICAALQKARLQKGEPTFIVSHTTKGKGVSFMENQAGWHGTVPLSEEELSRALAEIDAGPVLANQRSQ